WNCDPAFLETFVSIREFTLVDLYRCFELWELVRQSSKLQSGAIIEVGVWKGGTGALIAKAAHSLGLNAPVYLCDTFRGVVKAGQHDTYYKGGEHADASVLGVRRLLDSLDLRHVQILEGVFPEDTGSNLEHETFRFCHIDVDVYQSAKDILTWLW